MSAEAIAGASAWSAGPPRLLDAFREVYAEVVRNVQAIGGEEPPTHEAIKQRLVSLLARQAAAVGDSLGDHERAEFDEAQYVMVAMADEVFLQMEWAGREPWARRPLETESRFGTHVAGERVFNRLDEIFTNRISVSGDLLSVYLAALSLGFRGRYRFDPTGGDVGRFRRDLVREIRRAEPRMVAPASDLCPDALRGVRDKEPRVGLRGLREGLLPLVLVLSFMLALGHLLWFYKTSPVREKLDLIEEARERVEAEQQRAKSLPDAGGGVEPLMAVDPIPSSSPAAADADAGPAASADAGPAASADAGPAASADAGADPDGGAP